MNNERNNTTAGGINRRALGMDTYEREALRDYG